MLLVTTCAPPTAKRWWISGAANVASNAAWSFSTIERGVPAGTKTPCHELLTISGYPASIIVGTCGRASIRLAVEMPSAFSRPAWTKVMAEESVTNMTLRFAAEQAP